MIIQQLQQDYSSINSFKKEFDKDEIESLIDEKILKKEYNFAVTGFLKLLELNGDKLSADLWHKFAEILLKLEENKAGTML